MRTGNAVVNVYINREKNFSFVEFRTGSDTKQDCTSSYFPALILRLPIG